MMLNWNQNIDSQVLTFSNNISTVPLHDLCENIFKAVICYRSVEKKT